MNSAVVKTSPFAGFEASVATCVALLRRSWMWTALCLLAWLVVPPTIAFDTLGYFAIAQCVVIPGVMLLTLRSQLIGAELYLPVSTRTRALAVALVGTLISLAGFLTVTALFAAFSPAVREQLDPTLPLWILATGAVSLLPELPGHPVLDRLGWVALVGGLTWRAVQGAVYDGDLARLLPVPLLGFLFLISRVPRSWTQYPAPAFLQVGIRETAFPAGPADPILAVRALLAAERARSVGWRLTPLLVFILVRWFAYPLGPDDDRGVWHVVGWFGRPLFTAIPFLLPVSVFGVEAAGVALTLPVSPLKVHHAVIREAAIRAGLVFGVFVAVEAARFGVGAVLTAGERGGVSYWLELLMFQSWIVPAWALAVGASAWVTYPSRLTVFLVKAVLLGGALPALTVWFVLGVRKSAGWSVGELVLSASAFVTLLALLALLLGELRARRAFRPYRSVA